MKLKSTKIQREHNLTWFTQPRDSFNIWWQRKILNDQSFSSPAVNQYKPCVDFSKRSWKIRKHYYCKTLRLFILIIQSDYLNGQAREYLAEIQALYALISGFHILSVLLSEIYFTDIMYIHSFCKYSCAFINLYSLLLVIRTKYRNKKYLNEIH